MLTTQALVAEIPEEKKAPPGGDLDQGFSWNSADCLPFSMVRIQQAAKLEATRAAAIGEHTRSPHSPSRTHPRLMPTSSAGLETE